MVAHRVRDRQVRFAGLFHVVVVGAFAFVRPAKREKWFEKGATAPREKRDDRHHVQPGHSDVHVKAADDGEPKVFIGRCLGRVNDGLDLVNLRPELSGGARYDSLAVYESGWALL